MKYINDYWEVHTGYNGFNDTEDPETTNKRRKHHNSVLKQHKSDIWHIDAQLIKIDDFIGTHKSKPGKFNINSMGIEIPILLYKDIKKFARLIKKTLKIDEKRAEEMMNVAMRNLEDEDFKRLYDHLKNVAE
jgi:predicted RNA-binding protein